jgi:hypothetical protein
LRINPRISDNPATNDSPTDGNKGWKEVERGLDAIIADQRRD